MKKEKITGGLSSGKSLRDIALMHLGLKKSKEEKNQEIESMIRSLKRELALGMKVELEHTPETAVAREIAMDHLYEDPKYYTKLKRIEKGKETKKISLSELSEIVIKTLNEMDADKNMKNRLF